MAPPPLLRLPWLSVSVYRSSGWVWLRSRNSGIFQVARSYSTDCRFVGILSLLLYFWGRGQRIGFVYLLFFAFVLLIGGFFIGYGSHNGFFLLGLYRADTAFAVDKGCKLG
jgi:hypothetical protein